MADIIRPLKEVPREHAVQPMEVLPSVEGEQKREAEPMPARVAEEKPRVPSGVPPSSTARSIQTPVAKSPLLVNVEKILEEDIGEVYFTMQPEQQKKFKEQGDRVAVEIEGLIAKARASAARLIGLITSWLLIIPGVSRFFIERASKIKTDKLLRLQREK